MQPPKPKPPPRPQLTHFLCIPLATTVGRPQLADSLATFHADVAATAVAMTSGGNGGPSSANNRNATTRRGPLPPAALRAVGTLHLTLGVLSLGDGDRLQEAVSRLQSLAKRNEADEGSAGGKDKPISMALRGLHAMQPPARATVLYASPVDEKTGSLAAAGGPLLELCERVRTVFADLLVPDERPLLLHATIVNTVYAKQPRISGGRGGGRGRGGEKLTFDARELIERYDDFVWMEKVPIHKVALCRMGAQTTAMDADGAVVDAAYPVEAEVRI
ncbi:hypothetical protein SPBR_01977 [Sporothrix brasiliensis 5110]|uniref:A-kinase anchor protein 7-like phosphoesterase domain-containing protein n=1 Tax=Sporothrix brasiliensis 5110 TaxID=1398154 RepID=A0A0C2IXK0_9PEZI|nr:uncharacterized protein SPBR_01977 [Sporothrix brasiliensis 5110]KIH91475.1 hypothetical protein SPBR_01977 [Sporothrix brasiliensis 5110]